jgi:hypothetical protein
MDKTGIEWCTIGEHLGEPGNQSSVTKICGQGVHHAARSRSWLSAPTGGGRGSPSGRPGSCSRAATTACGVRRSDAMVYRPVTTASCFVPRFCPVLKRTEGAAGDAGTTGTPVPSACTTRIVGAGAGAGGSAGCAEKALTAPTASATLVSMAWALSDPPGCVPAPSGSRGRTHRSCHRRPMPAAGRKSPAPASSARRRGGSGLAAPER